MKPRRLEICAFGPFATVETIDFTEVEGKSLLLIHGPTGSGKTTVLDAMCFALFGDTSGDEREGKQMRSDNAAMTQTTSVTYDFALGEKVFRVYRQPQQERAAKRGGGVTKDTHKATLWDRSRASSASDEGSVYATGAAKVSSAITELFGFESEQFRQVVMLPQGKFRKLLTAESKDKEQILQKLFQTGVYGRVERALLEKSNRLKRDFEDDSLRMQTILEPADVETIEELTTVIGRVESAHAEAKATTPKVKAVSEEAAAALTRGRRDREKLSEVESAATAVAELAKKATAVAELREQQKSAQAARPLIELESNVTARLEEATSAAAEHEDAKRRLRDAKSAKKEADDKLAAESAREAEREEAASELANKRAMSKSVARLAEARQKLVDARAAEVAAEKSSKTAMASREAATRALETARADREAAGKEAARLEGCELALESARNRRSKHKKLLAARATHESAARKLQVAQEKHLAAERARQARVAEQEALEKAWQAGQAGALARTLVDGHACPVCGSAEHPDPASASDSLPTEAELEGARRAVNDAREHEALARQTESDARSASSREEAALEPLTEELGDVAGADPIHLDQEVEGADKALEKAAAAAAAIPSLELDIEAAGDKLAAAEARVEATAAALRDAAVERARSVEAVEQLEEHIPAALREEGALAEAIDALTSKLEGLKAALKKAQELAQRAAESLASAEQSRAGTERRVEETREQARQHQASFEERRLEAGFETEPAYAQARQLVFRLDEMETQIKAHDESRKAASERLGRAQEAAEGIEMPDLEVLESAAKDASEKSEAAIRLEAETRNELSRLVSIGKEHESIREKVASLESEWGVVASLAKLANGQVSGHNISFQRFVLGALLDEVLLAATERLTRMSKGRYSLKRQPQSRHKGRAGGLDLEVIDTYTGRARPVTTLSGGESFLAALSLSLGLADVVQSYSGGIRLDTLFIDEGFGTLDASALDLALDTLSELNAEGRLVGIISHVEELRSRIGTRLEVVPGDGGSTTRFAF